MPLEGPIHLRRATPEDAPAIAQVHVASWRGAYAGVLPQSVLDLMSVGLRTEHWRGEIGLAPSHRRPWVAEDATGRVIGFVAAGPARDDDLPPRTGEIYAIYVDPECWSHGVGTHLLQHALRDLKEAGEMSVALWCVAEHAPSRRFYAKHGWHADGATRIDTFADEQVDMVRYRHDIT